MKHEPTPTRRSLLLSTAATATAAAAAGLGLATTVARAQTYPSRPIRLVVPFPPGGSVDFVARTLQEPLAQSLGQPLVIENRAGAAGALGSDAVAKAAPDGYTVLLALSSHTINPLVQKTPYDVERDFVSITRVVSLPQLIFANPNAPFDSLAGLIHYARQNPGKLSYATAGSGSPSHVAGEWLKQRTGTFFVHIPYRGGGPATLDVMGGVLPIGILSISAASAQAHAGKVRPLAVTTRQRSPAFPDVPTVAEALNLPDFEVDSWIAAFAPRGTPPAIVERLNTELRRALAAPGIADRLKAQGALPAPGTPAELDAIVKRELQQWQTVIAAANIKPD